MSRMRNAHSEVLAVLLFAFLFALLIPAISFASSNGTCGENLTWTLSNAGTLTISGTGAMDDYSWGWSTENRRNMSTAPWGIETVKKVVVKNGVTSIGDNAFRFENSEITSVQIAGSVKTIGNNAFVECYMTSVTLPNGVESIGDGAFAMCHYLQTISIPNSVTEIGAGAFSDCECLDNVTIPYGITTIKRGLFSSCWDLTTVSIPSSVMSIESGVFSMCYELRSIEIPESVTNIADDANLPDTIYGVPGSYAQIYAMEHNRAFVPIHEVPATSVTFDKDEISVPIGSVFKPAITIEPWYRTDDVTWKSNNTNVVTVDDDGTLHAIAIGTSTIKVTAGSVSATCRITVAQAAELITIDQLSVSIEAEDTLLLTATVYPTEVADKSVGWSSSDESIATVDENGLITGHKKGAATITATALGGFNVTADCVVTVVNDGHFVTDVSELESQHNYPNNSADFWQFTIEDADQLKVTFNEQTKVEEDFDFLILFDQNRNEIGTYTGTELAARTITIPGNTVRIKLTSDDSGSEWGFKVTSVIGEITTYIVKYDANGGTDAPDTQRASLGTTLVLDSTCPVRDNHYFLGWSPSRTAIAPLYQPADVYAENTSTVLYAVWGTPDFILPNDLMLIDEAAFENGAFTFVKIPDNAVDIRKCAFAYCRNLKYIYIPATVTEIDSDAFDGLSNLTIFGSRDSVAETYATEHEFTFIATQ